MITINPLANKGILKRSSVRINDLSMAQMAQAGGGFEASGTPTARWQADAITGLNDTDPCTDWVDSVASLSMPSSTVDKQPLYKASGQNGMPYLQFDGDDDWMGDVAGSAIGAHTQPITIFLVYDITDNDSYSTVLAGGGTGNFWIWDYINTDIRLAAATQVMSGMIHPENPSIVTVHFNGASSFVRLNGNQSAALDTGGIGFSTLYFGALVTGNARWAPMDLYEVIVYNGTEDPTANEAMLSSKYDITIA